MTTAIEARRIKAAALYRSAAAPTMAQLAVILEVSIGTVAKDLKAMGVESRPAGRKPRQAECHPDQPHYSLGKCRKCYQNAAHAERVAYRNSW